MEKFFRLLIIGTVALGISACFAHERTERREGQRHEERAERHDEHGDNHRAEHEEHREDRNERRGGDVILIAP